MKIHRIIARLTPVAIAATALTAQAPYPPVTPRFQRIVQLAQDGYGDSARTMIGGILARMPAGDASLPEALYTAALVARTGDSTSRLLKRISVDFPSSAWADKAQLRLVLLAYGNGDMEDAVGRVGRLFSDYPASPVIPAAALWGARAAFEDQKAQQACDWITRGLAAVGDDVEIRNQLQFMKQRCNVGEGARIAPPVAETLRAGPPPRTDTATRRPVPPPPPPPPPPAPAAARSPWRIQVAAIADKAVIRRLTQRIEAAGFKVYLVDGPRGLTKVQAGPFATRAAASTALAKVRSAVAKAAFITAAP